MIPESKTSKAMIPISETTIVQSILASNYLFMRINGISLLKKQNS